MRLRPAPIIFGLLAVSTIVFAQPNQPPDRLSDAKGSQSAAVSKATALDSSYLGLPILHLQGTAYDIGFQHGLIMKERIEELVRLWKKNLESTFNMPAEEFIQAFLDSTDYVSAVKKWTPRSWDEIRGISAGSGIEFSTIFAFQLTDEIWTSARLLNLGQHCTSIGINNYRKNKGANILAQTVDITPFYHGFEILLDIGEEAAGTRKRILTFPGYLGATGLNEHIGITCNSLMDLKSSLDGLPVCCVVRGVLDCSSFQEGEAFIKSVRHASGQNYIIGSRTDMKSFECSASQAVEFWPDSSKLYTYHTNYSLANKEFHPAYVAYVRKIHNSTPDAYRHQCMRFKSLERRIKGNSKISVQTIKATLASKDYPYDPICNAATCMAVIMQFARNTETLMISPGSPDSTSYIEIGRE
jgi:isopenicillin-N N-acyltransferase-like protein